MIKTLETTKYAVIGQGYIWGVGENEESAINEATKSVEFNSGNEPTIKDYDELKKYKNFSKFEKMQWQIENDKFNGWKLVEISNQMLNEVKNGNIDNYYEHPENRNLIISENEYNELD